MKMSKAITTEINQHDSGSLSPESTAAGQFHSKHKIRKCRTCHTVVESGNALCPRCGSDLKRKPSSFFAKTVKKFVKYCDRLMSQNVGKKRKPEIERKTKAEKKKIKYRW